MDFLKSISLCARVYLLLKTGATQRDDADEDEDDEDEDGVRGRRETSHAINTPGTNDERRRGGANERRKDTEDTHTRVVD